MGVGVWFWVVYVDLGNWLLVFGVLNCNGVDMLVCVYGDWVGLVVDVGGGGVGVGGVGDLFGGVVVVVY